MMLPKGIPHLDNIIHSMLECAIAVKANDAWKYKAEKGACFSIRTCHVWPLSTMLQSSWAAI